MAPVPTSAQVPYAPHPPAASQACAAVPQRRFVAVAPSAAQSPSPHGTPASARAVPPPPASRAAHPPSPPAAPPAPAAALFANYRGIATDDSLTHPAGAVVAPAHPGQPPA